MFNTHYITSSSSLISPRVQTRNVATESILDSFARTEKATSSSWRSLAKLTPKTVSIVRLHDQCRSGDRVVFSSSCLQPLSLVVRGVLTGHTSSPVTLWRGHLCRTCSVVWSSWPQRQVGEMPASVCGANDCPVCYVRYEALPEQLAARTVQLKGLCIACTCTYIICTVSAVSSSTLCFFSFDHHTVFCVKLTRTTMGVGLKWVP